MASPEREIYVMLGDGGYLMMNSEIITSIQEGIKLVIVLIDNHGFASIGGLSQSIGSEKFGTQYKFRNETTGQLDGEVLPVDLAKNAESLGANVLKVSDIKSFNEALAKAKESKITTVIHIETVPERKLAGYGHAWWEVPVAEVSEMDGVKTAYSNYIEQKKKQRYFF